MTGAEPSVLGMAACGGDELVAKPTVIRHDLDTIQPISGVKIVNAPSCVRDTMRRFGAPIPYVVADAVTLTKFGIFGKISLVSGFETAETTIASNFRPKPPLLN